MNNDLPKLWIENLKKLDIAFQPILNIHTGKIYGVEALLRNFQDIGFKSIFALFDKVSQDNILYSFDLKLREKALIKFSKIKNYEEMKLFYNLDNRLLEMPNFSHGNTLKIINKLGIKKENIFFEISERHELNTSCSIESIIEHYKDEHYSVAIDDFGVGYSGYKLLYEFTPDIIKIDRFFLQDIEHNYKKKLLVRNITHLAIQLGIQVIAEGIETKAELLTCREIGCHFIQGYFIQKPTKNTDKILKKYTEVYEIIQSDRRFNNSKTKAQTYIDKIDPIYIDTKMNKVIEYFKRHSNVSVVPIINSSDEPIGILKESQIKEFLYSPYGMSLLLNDESRNSKLINHMHTCLSTDINSDIATIIELFSNDKESTGIVITKNSNYYGFLSAKAIINAMNEENILLARDQNPLTKLPGNKLIEGYLAKITESQEEYILCYFDLDNFKAFNDVYGFRNGDRVIQLFADSMRKELSNKYFIAHIGGDDFFAASKIDESSVEEKFQEISLLLKKFVSSAKELYTKEDRDNGYITAKDRDDVKKRFPLLTVSASILELNQSSYRSLDNINNVLSVQKKVAKREKDHISISGLL